MFFFLETTLKDQLFCFASQSKAALKKNKKNILCPYCCDHSKHPAMATSDNVDF